MKATTAVTAAGAVIGDSDEDNDGYDDDNGSRGERGSDGDGGCGGDEQRCCGGRGKSDNVLAGNVADMSRNVGTT